MILCKSSLQIFSSLQGEQGNSGSAGPPGYPGQPVCVQFHPLRLC